MLRRMLIIDDEVRMLIYACASSLAYNLISGFPKDPYVWGCVFSLLFVVGLIAYYGMNLRRVRANILVEVDAVLRRLQNVVQDNCSSNQDDDARADEMVTRQRIEAAKMASAEPRLRTILIFALLGCTSAIGFYVGAFLNNVWK